MGGGYAMGRIIKWVYLFIKFTTPWVFRTLGATIRLVFLTITSIWVGIPTAVRRIAAEWTKAAMRAGVHSQFDTYIYYCLCFVASVTILAGWIVTAYLTVWLIQMIL
jgi:hypothetical protein